MVKAQLRKLSIVLVMRMHDIKIYLYTYVAILRKPSSETDVTFMVLIFNPHHHH